MRTFVNHIATVLPERWNRPHLCLVLICLVQALVIRFILERFDWRLFVALLALLAVGAKAPVVLVHVWQSMMNLRTRIRWWHGTWALLFLSSLVFRIRDVNSIQDAPVDSWAAFRIAAVGLAGSTLLLRLAVGDYRWLNSLGKGLVGAMGAYCGVCVLSAVWSVYPLWTAYRAFEYLVDVSMLAAALVYVQDESDMKSLFDWTWVLHAALLGSVWIGVVLWPHLAIARGIGVLGTQISGVMPGISANGVGELGALLGTVAVSRLVARGRGLQGSAFYWAVLAASVVSLVFSQTRSSLTAFVLGTALVLFFSRRVGVVVLVMVVLAAIFLQTSAATSFWSFVRRGQSEELFSSLSGRRGWWAYAFQKLQERPFTGFGAYAASRFVVMNEISDGSTSSLHNTYVEVLLGTSAWGLVPLLAALSGAWWRLARSFPRPLTVEAIGVLGVLTVRSFFTSQLIWHPSLSFLLVIGYAEYLSRRKEFGSC